MLRAGRARTCVAYDPAYAYELAVIIQDGIRRMYGEQESVFYYLTVMNEKYAMPPMPDGRARGHPQGHVPVAARPPTPKAQAARRSCSAAARSCHEVVKAQEMLDEQYGVARRRLERRPATASSTATAHACERWNLLHPGETPRVPYVDAVLRRTRRASIVAASDYLKALPDLDRPLGAAAASSRSAPTASAAARDRAALRDFFEVDARFVAVATLAALARDGQIDAKVVAQAIKDLDINPEKINPAIA